MGLERIDSELSGAWGAEACHLAWPRVSAFTQAPGECAPWSPLGRRGCEGPAVEALTWARARCGSRTSLRTQEATCGDS